MQMPNKIKPSNRRRARILALQAVYQWQVTADSEQELTRQFSEKLNPNRIDVSYFEELLGGVLRNIISIDQKLIPVLDRKQEDLDLVERAILRLAACELCYCPEVPFKVVINEALELAKLFGSVDGYKYVNGVLDKVAKQLGA